MRALILLFAIGFIFPDQQLKAQNSLDAYLDIGTNQLSGGLYSQVSNLGCFEKAKWGVEGGYQLGLIQSQNVIFNSWYLNPYARIKIGNTILDVGSEYLWTAMDQDLRETNWIISARTSLEHWHLGFGTGFRTYRLSQKAANEPDQPYPDSRITEAWNMMYNATYLLKPPENKWNLSGTFTNYDHFIIQQENNPMFNLRFDYKTTIHLSLYSEVWYVPAGLMVIRVTYYGMFARLGLLWKI